MGDPTVQDREDHVVNDGTAQQEPSRFAQDLGRIVGGANLDHRRTLPKLQPDSVEG
jgi:hypothetical protein